MAPKNKIFDAAIIHSTRMDVRDALRESLKKINIYEMKVASDAETCIQFLRGKERTLLILDWEPATEKHIRKVFAHLQENMKVEVRPIFLLAKKLSDQLLGLAKEHSIAKVHTGDLTANSLKDLLSELVRAEEHLAPLRGVLQKVTEHRAKNDWPGADKILGELHTRLPQNPRVTAELAENMIQQERWQEALTLLEPLRTANPIYMRALHLIARCEMKLGEMDKAVETLKGAKVLNPYNADRMVTLGNLFLDLDRVAEAKAEFKEAQKVDPGNNDALEGIGKCLLLDGEVNEALALMKESASPRELASLFNTSAVLSMRHGRFKEGMALYDSAVKVVSNLPLLLSKLSFNRGIGFVRWKKEKEALLSLEDAVKRDPNFEKAKVSYAIIAAKKGLPVPPHMAPKIPLSSHSPEIRPEAIGAAQRDYLGLNFDDDLEDFEAEEENP